MIDFSKIEPVQTVNIDYILSKITEEAIFLYYFGPFEIGKPYMSKFRKDTKPSTGFYISRKTGSIIYNDLATGDKYTCFGYVAKLFNITTLEAINRIATDFGLLDNKPEARAIKVLSQAGSFDREVKKNTIIQFIPGIWKDYHILYWKQYGISLDQLREENVYVVDRLWINKTEWYSLDKLCFAYIVNEIIDGKLHTYVKIYQPYNKECKWISNVPLSVPFGLYNLNYHSDHLIITKAKKDMLVLRNIFPSVIGTQNESEAALSYHIEFLKNKFPRRTIIWDADPIGVENCRKFNEKGFGYFNTPNDLLPDIKDVSDYVKVYGLKALEKLLKIKGIL